MNPAMILSGAKMLAIIAVLMYATSFLKGCEENRVLERDATIVAAADKVSAQAHAANLAIANAQLEAITKERDRALADAVVAQAETAAEFATIEQDHAVQMGMLEGNRLNVAIRGNRERIEKLANDATRERFDEVESIFDGT
jgi:hypothetical protein